jgi:hypothetical protein
LSQTEIILRHNVSQNYLSLENADHLKIKLNVKFVGDALNFTIVYVHRELLDRFRTHQNGQTKSLASLRTIASDVRHV